MPIIYYDDPATDAPKAPKITYEDRRQPTEATDARIAQEAAYKGIAGLGDSVLNAPTNAWNILKSIPSMLAREPLPQMTPVPDIIRKGMETAGMINPDIQPKGFIQNAIDFGTQGAVGGALTGGASLPRVAAGAGMGALSGELAGGTMEATGNPALATAAGLLPAVPNAIRPTTNTAAQRRNAVVDSTLLNARENGYVVPPSAATGGSWLTNRIEGIGGKAAVGQEASVRNQQVTNKIARQEAGLNPNDPISPVTLKDARDVIAAPYREVAAMSPLAKNFLEKMQETRAEAKAQWDYYKASKTPSALKDAKALDTKADYYEMAIERIAKKNGNPDLIDRVREARVALAKNYAVDNAVNVGSGDVDAHVIGRMLDKRKPLSDGLETIGKFANAFDSYSREGVKGPGISKLEGYGALGLSAAGHSLFPAGGVAAGAIPLIAPPLARSFILSKAMQGQRQYGPGILSTSGYEAAPIATNLIMQQGPQ